LLPVIALSFSSLKFSQHKQLTALFGALNDIAEEPIPFLGGLKLKFQLSDPREPEFRNRMQRVGLDFG